LRVKINDGRKKMIQLKSQTWYYLYTDGKEIYLSEDTPTRSDKDKCWYHPELGYKIYGKPFIIYKQTSSENIQEFIDVSINIKDIRKEDRNQNGKH